MNNLATLADRYSDIKAQIEALTLQLDAVKAEIKATGRDEIVGERAIVKVSLSERNNLDTKMVRAVLTPEQLAAFTKTTLIESITVKRIQQTVAA